MTFEGLYVAIVTPFDAAGEIDEDGLRRLVRMHVEAGTDGLVPCGTTGENPTFSQEEHLRVIRTVVTEAAGRLQVVAGAGSNDTKKAVALARGAKEAGADGLLVITPYYNKPQPDGLVAYFGAVASATDLPVMMYNVPGRTGVNMGPDVVERLADVPTITAVKEASGSLDQISEIIRRSGDRVAVLAGDDSLALPILAVGGRGVVSVVGNVVPGRMKRLVHAALAGRYDEARREHLALLDLAYALFVESNPAPVKYALNLMGMPVGEVRPPLAPLRPDSRARVEAALAALQIEVTSTAG